MAWDRYVQLTVGYQGSGFIVSDLDIDFEINRSITLSENTAEFTIYNAKEDTRKEVLKKGSDIIFDVGYKDETTSTVFAGNVTYSNSYKSGMDWVTEIKAIAGRGANVSLENIDVSVSYSAGSLITGPITHIANLMGLVVHGIGNSNVKLPNGWVYAGSVNGALRYIKDILTTNGINMYIDNNELVIHKVNQLSKFKVVILSYTGGLLSIEDISESNTQASTSKNKSNDIKKKLKFTSLIIPQLQVNGPVIFKTDQINATYILEKIMFKGDNYGKSDFICEGETIEQ